WRPEPGVATPPADSSGRVRERRSFFRSWYHTEDRRDVGAAVARIHPYRPRARGRVRIRRPALSVADRDCRADYRGALVGPAVLWRQQTSARFAPSGGQPIMKPAANRTRRNGTVRCAIYTRKSSEEGLKQEFNSLQAQ